MTLEAIAGSVSVPPLLGYTKLIGTGEHVELRLYMPNGITVNELDELQGDLISRGVLLDEDIVEDNRILAIKFKMMPGVIETMSDVINVDTDGWQLFKRGGLVSGLAITIGIIIVLGLLTVHKRRK